MLSIIENNIVYRLGRNAQENFNLIDDAESEDIWFHLDDLPSGHCILKKPKDSILTNEMKLFAGSLIKKYSKAKNNKNTKIIFTEVKNVVKTKNLGEVRLKVKAGEFFC